MTNQPPKKRPSRKLKDPEERRKFFANLSPQMKKMLEDMSRRFAMNDAAIEILQTEIKEFTNAATSIIHCFYEVISIHTDRNNYTVPDYVYESEHERLNVVEDILIKIIKMSDIESVPQERQTLVTELMLNVLKSVVADERKRLS